MSSIKKLNKIPTVVQKVDPRILNLKKEINNLHITINRMRNTIEDLQKKNKRSRVLMKKMDCVIHVLSENTSNNFIKMYLIKSIEMSGKEIIDKSKEEEAKRRRNSNKGPLTVFADLK